MRFYSILSNIDIIYHYFIIVVPIHTGDCGVPAISPLLRRKDSRIVGGTTAKPHSWPWQVNVYYLLLDSNAVSNVIFTIGFSCLT